MSQSVTTLSVSLFGSPSLQLEGRPLRPLRTRKGYTLFALLALRMGRTIDRDFIAGTLWPESGPEQALSSLRRALTDLRDALGSASSCILGPTARTLLLHLPPTAVDVLHFDLLLAQTGEDLEPQRQAVLLHRGPLLEGSTEDWVLQERQQRDSAACAALYRLAADAQNTGNLALAIAYLRHALCIDPVNERTCRELMQALHDSGSPAAVADTYRQFQSYLRRTLDTAPSDETVHLLQRLQKSSSFVSAIVHRSATDRSCHGKREVNCASAPDSLPIYRTSFHGREEALSTLSEHLSASRIVTLIGPGGVGKTRLAVEAGRRLALFPDGIYFIDLARQRIPYLLPQVIAAVLGIAETPGQDLLLTLSEQLQAERCLLILDNAEHLTEAVALVVENLYNACPDLHFLITSRQRLRLPQEIVFPIEPLSVPSPTAPTDIAVASASDAVALFCDRARLVWESFTLTEQNIGVIIDLCRRLDSLPLAIELAAARLHTLPLDRVAASLYQNLAPAPLSEDSDRQHSLRSLLDGSFALLSPKEQTLLRRLAIFVGPMEVAAIHAVCGGSEEEGQTLPLLSNLVEKSLLVFDGKTYRLLETVRQYALCRLTDTGDYAETLHRYRQWHLKLAETAEKQLRGPEASCWAARLDLARDDFHQSLHSCPPICAETALRMVAALAPYYLLRGYLTEGRRLLQEIRERFSERLPDWPDQWILLLNGLGTLAYRQSDYDAAEAYLQEKLALCRLHNDPLQTAHTLGNLGNVASARQDIESSTGYFMECLSLYRERKHKQGIATVLMNLGNIATMNRDYPGAVERLSESLAIWRELGSIQGLANTLHNLGIVAFKDSRYTEADGLLSEALILRQQLNHRQGIAHTLLYLQETRLALGDRRSDLLKEAWTVLYEIGDRQSMAEALRIGAELMLTQNDSQAAVTLFAAMAAQREALKITTLSDREQVFLRILRDTLGAVTYDALYFAGKHTDNCILMKRFFYLF